MSGGILWIFRIFFWVFIKRTESFKSNKIGKTSSNYILQFLKIFR